MWNGTSIFFELAENIPAKRSRPKPGRAKLLQIADGAQEKLKELQGEMEKRLEEAEKKMSDLQADLDLWKKRAHESRAHVALTLQYGRPAMVDDTKWYDGDGRAVIAAD